MNTAVRGNMNSEGKLNWYNVTPDDMADVTCSDEQFKKINF